MPDNRTMWDIRALLNAADTERLREWAENWLIHVANTQNGPDIINEEMHKAFEEDASPGIMEHPFEGTE